MSKDASDLAAMFSGIGSVPHHSHGGASYQYPDVTLNQKDDVRNLTAEQHTYFKDQVRQIMAVGEPGIVSQPKKHSSHANPIPAGTVGEFTKLIEEFAEARDAHLQKLPLMELWELSDFIGALIVYLEKHFSGVTINDLIEQAKHTNRLFEEGKRSPK